MISLKKLIKNQRGSSLLLTLALIFVLAAFGIIAISVSLTNLQMGDRYRDRMSEFYKLDAAAETGMGTIDELLAKAERLSQNYIKNEHYKDAGSVTISDDGTNYIVDGGVQTKIYNLWNELVYKTNTYTVGSDVFLNEASYREDMRLFSEDIIKRLYLYFASHVIEARRSDFYSIEYLGASSYSKTDLYNFVLPSVPLSPNPTISQRETAFTNLCGYYDSAGDYKPGSLSSDNARITLTKQYLGENNKTITVTLNVIQPKYKALKQTMYFPVKGNPIWANAISASGSINFDNTGATVALPIYITGDVYSSSRDLITSMDTGINEGGLISGISIRNTNVNVTGNIYSRADVHVVSSQNGNEGSLSVNKRSINRNLFLNKDKMYGGNGVQSHVCTTEGSALGYNIDKNIILNGDNALINVFFERYEALDNVFKFIFKDIDVKGSGNTDTETGGNVYCNNLAIESPASNGFINIDKNVWTYDDIQLDGKNSNITVNGTYVGLRSASEEDDPNASSCVINNSPKDGSKINLNGKLVVPGVAFIPFEDDATGKVYFKTSESISSVDLDILSKYVEAEGSIYQHYKKNVKVSGTTTPETTIPVSIDIKSDWDKNPDGSLGNATMNKISWFFDQYNASGVTKPETGISITPTSGYILGTGIAKSGSNYIIVKKDSGISCSSTGFDFENDYNSVKSFLPTVFKSKTMDLGRTNSSTTLGTQFSSLVDEAKMSIVGNKGVIFKWVGGDRVQISDIDSGGQLILNDDYDGIIYYKGNLTISKGTKNRINGTVICDGNLTINPGVEISYNESIIKNIIQYSQVAYDFFKPGEMGEELFHTNFATYDLGSGEREDNQIRYRIAAWKESGKITP